MQCFSSSLEGVSTYAEHLLAAFPSLCGPTHSKPSQLGWGQVIVQARSSDAALHPSSYWSNSPSAAWKYVRALSCWITNDCPTKRKTRWDGVSRQNAVLAMLTKCQCQWILNTSQTVSSLKHHHTTSSVLHGGNQTCGDHPFTYSASHNYSWNQKS